MPKPTTWADFRSPPDTSLLDYAVPVHEAADAEWWKADPSPSPAEIAKQAAASDDWWKGYPSPSPQDIDKHVSLLDKAIPLEQGDRWWSQFPPASADDIKATIDRIEQNKARQTPKRRREVFGNVDAQL